MKIPTATADFCMKITPDRLYVPFLRLAAARRTATAPKFAVSANRNRTTAGAGTAHAASAGLHCWKDLVKVVFKNFPPAKFCADGNKGMAHLVPVFLQFAQIATAGDGMASLQMAVGENRNRFATRNSAAHAASAGLSRRKDFVNVVFKDFPPTKLFTNSNLRAGFHSGQIIATTTIQRTRPASTLAPNPLFVIAYLERGALFPAPIPYPTSESNQSPRHIPTANLHANQHEVTPSILDVPAPHSPFAIISK